MTQFPLYCQKYLWVDIENSVL